VPRPRQSEWPSESRPLDQGRAGVAGLLRSLFALHRHRSSGTQLLRIGKNPIHGRYANTGASGDFGAL
jgi:hypothetical protein